MKDKIRLVDNCEYSNICFSDMLSELRRITQNQAIIVELLFKILDNFNNNKNRSDTILEEVKDG